MTVKPSRGESSKGHGPITKLGDDQEKVTIPPSGAKRIERERVLGQQEEKKAVDEDSQEGQQRKPAPPMRKNRPENKKIPKKQRQLLKQVPTRNPYRKGKQGKGSNVDSTL